MTAQQLQPRLKPVSPYTKTLLTQLTLRRYFRCKGGYRARGKNLIKWSTARGLMTAGYAVEKLCTNHTGNRFGYLGITANGQDILAGHQQGNLLCLS